MSQQPPDEYFDRPPEKGPPPAPKPRPARAWLCLLLMVGLALIVWQFAPKNEVTVSYSPWFLDQVDTDNIQSLTIEGMEVHGVLRRDVWQPARTPSGNLPIRKFNTVFPSELSVEKVVETLRNHSRQGKDPVLIEVRPPASSSGLLWIALLLPSLVMLGLIILMVRKGRTG